MTNAEMKKKLDLVIADMMSTFKVPSIMVSVSRGGETFYCGGGIADLETGAKADENTIYAIASASKAFIATSICMLADEGKLSLDEPVKTYLPGFKMYDSYMTEHLTMRDAMSHRSGLPRHDVTWVVHPELNIRDLVHMLRYMEPAFEPRARMNYQNHMFSLATVVVEEVSGMTWDSFVKERILEPLGMTRTYCLPAQFRGIADNVAQPNALIDGEVRPIPYLDISNVGCAGCVSSSVRDLAIWARLQAGEGELDGVRYFSKERANDLHTPQMIIKPGEMTDMYFPEVTHTAYGLGWFIESYRGHTFVYHGGTINGYKSQVGYIPGEDVSFAILTNLERNQTPLAISYAIADLALGLEPLDWTQKMKVELERLGAISNSQRNALMAMTKDPVPFAHPLDDYCGEYSHGAYGKAVVTKEGDKLFIQLGTAKTEVLPAGYESFVLDMPMMGTVPGMFIPDFSGRIVAAEAMLEANLKHFIRFEKL
ncbi:MAG: serine hydrolase [Clostridia bacterium]|nr:serine hydrolase [Clostridia bacterium]